MGKIPSEISSATSVLSQKYPNINLEFDNVAANHIEFQTKKS